MGQGQQRAEPLVCARQQTAGVVLRAHVDQLIDQAEPQRGIGVDHVTGDQQALGTVRANHAPHQPLHPFRGNQADPRLVQANAEIAGRHDPVIAAQCVHATARRCVTGGRRDHRDRAGGKRACGAEKRLPGLADGLAVIAQRQQVGNVQAGGEDPRRAGQHDAARTLADRRSHRVVQLPAQGRVQRIDRRAGQLQLDHVAMHPGLDVAHGRSPSVQR